jgi:hypothetical protein
LVRPKNRISQSRLSQIFFYRDNEFDTLILGASNITELVETEYDTSGNVTRASAVGTYNLTDSDYTTNGFGSEAVFQAVVDGTGEVTVTITDGGQNFRAGDLITLPDSVLGSSGADAIVMTVDTVPNGIEYLNPRTNTVDGYFGRHYLKDPAAPQSTGDGFINPGDWVVQAKALIDNQEFIVEQTENWMLDNYPALVGTYVSSTLKHDIRTMVKSLKISDKNLDLDYEKDVLIQKLNNLIDLEGEIDHPIYGKMESEKIKFLIIHHTTHHFNQFDLIN